LFFLRFTKSLSFSVFVCFFLFAPFLFNFFFVGFFAIRFCINCTYIT
jgi:hypothetical protein